MTTAFVDRQACGLRPVDADDYAAGSFEGITLHWAGPSPWGRGGIGSHDRCPSIWRAFQAYHQDHNGWVDIAYNSGVCPHGTRFEGRPVWAKPAAQGEPGNSVSLAVCYIAGVGDRFTEEGKEGFLDEGARMAKWLKWGHRDWMATECPGPDITSWKDLGFPPPASYFPAPPAPIILPPGLDVVVIEPVAAVGRPGGGGWVFNSDGLVYSFDGADYYGGWNPTTHVGADDCVALVPTTSGRGYFLVDAAGEVFAYGDAVFTGNYRSDLWGPGKIVGAYSNTRQPTGGVTLVRADANLYRLPV